MTKNKLYKKPNIHSLHDVVPLHPVDGGHELLDERVGLSHARQEDVQVARHVGDLEAILI